MECVAATMTGGIQETRTMIPAVIFGTCMKTCQTPSMMSMCGQTAGMWMRTKISRYFLIKKLKSGGIIHGPSFFNICACKNPCFVKVFLHTTDDNVVFYDLADERA